MFSTYTQIYKYIAAVKQRVKDVLNMCHWMLSTILYYSNNNKNNTNYNRSKKKNTQQSFSYLLTYLTLLPSTKLIVCIATFDADTN